jgi:hypothetical protein
LQGLAPESPVSHSTPETLQPSAGGPRLPSLVVRQEMADVDRRRHTTPPRLQGLAPKRRRGSKCSRRRTTDRVHQSIFPAGQDGRGCWRRSGGRRSQELREESGDSGRAEVGSGGDKTRGEWLKGTRGRKYTAAQRETRAAGSVAPTRQGRLNQRSSAVGGQTCREPTVWKRVSASFGFALNMRGQECWSTP